jgi:MFS family permease
MEKTLDSAFDAMRKGKRFPIALMTVLLCIGVCIAYSHNTTPAPFFSVLFDFYNMDPVTDQPLMNLSMSIIYPFIIVCTFIGTMLESKLGTRRLFTLFMIFVTAGALLNLAASNYGIFLAGRIVYAIGFGLSIPTMGSAIMSWFRPKAREFMTALNGVFPLLGALLCFGTFAPAGIAFGGEGGLMAGWQMGAAFTGFITLAALIIWIAVTRKDIDSINFAAAEAKHMGVTESAEKGVFGWLLKRREVKSIMITFICDFTMYAYIATILPFWLMTAGAGMDEVSANVWAAIAFPLFGVIGVAAGATITTKTGRRKPVIVACQIIKLVGIMMAALLADVSVTFIIIGVALFGIGNGGWMSPMFLVPTELPGTNSTRVAGGFSLFLSSGYVAGFIMPIVGGIIATAFIAGSGITEQAAQVAYGYKWSMFILGLSHVIAVISALTLRETGPGRRPKLKENPESV